MKYILKTIGSVLFWVLGLLLLFMVLSGFYQHFVDPKGHTGFFGIGYAVVVSGSMEPKIHINDLIIYQAHEKNVYKEDDVIVYEREDSAEEEAILITHRIRKIDGDTLITRGDANTADDQPITFADVIGKVVWRIPYIGVIANFVKTPFGMISVFAVIVLLLIINIILSKRRKPELIDTAQGEQMLKY